MKKYIYPAAFILMALLTITVVLRLVVLGDTTEMEDDRLGINMTPYERTFVLNEMRDFLAGVQGITQACLDNDMQRAANIAKPLGMDVASHAPKGLLGKLPLEFKQLGFGIHHDLDQLAMDARDLADPQHTLRQLATAMNKCVACHAAYQIKVVTAE